MPLLLVRVLESIADLLWGDEPRETLSEGKLFMRFLGVKGLYCQSGDEAWRLVRDRIEAVFGPKLINWCLIGTAHQSSRRQSKIFTKAQTFFVSSDEEFAASEEARFYASVGLLCLHIAAVNDNQEALLDTLTTKLIPLHQEAIQKAFEYLIDNKSNLSIDKLESLFKASSPSARSSDAREYWQPSKKTPYRATKNSSTPTSSLGESFSYSPSNPSPAQHSFARGSPLQEFLKSHHAKKVVEGVQKELRETKTNLDNERGETLYLKNQLESITNERDKFKHDLDVTKSKLFAKNNGLESKVSMTDFQELQEKCSSLQEKLAELKDSKMYIKKLDEQLEKTLDANKDLLEKYDLSQGMMNEKSCNIKTLQDKLANFELKSDDLEEQNKNLKETINELKKQLREMQDISNHRQSMMAEFRGGENLNDISLDNPGGILSPPPGESMGDMVVLNLQEDNAILRSEVTANQEKYLNVQEKYEFEQATGKKHAEKALNLQGQLDNELKRVEDLVGKLGNEHDNLKQVQQSCDLALKENAEIKVMQYT